jgi:hypothetical protein
VWKGLSICSREKNVGRIDTILYNKSGKRESERIKEQKSFSISLSLHLTSMCCSSLYLSHHKAIVIQMQLMNNDRRIIIDFRCLMKIDKRVETRK